MSNRHVSKSARSAAVPQILNWGDSLNGQCYRAKAWSQHPEKLFQDPQHDGAAESRRDPDPVVPREKTT